MNFNTKSSPWTLASAVADADRFICGYWLPTGFLIFLSAFFFAPTRHSYTIFVVDLLLFPALFAVLSPSAWIKALRLSPMLGLVIAYLFYMAIDTLMLRGVNEFVEFMQWGIYILLFLISVGTRMFIAEQNLHRLLIIGATTAAGATIYTVMRDIRSEEFFSPAYRLIGYGALYNPLRSGHLFGAFALIAAWCVLCAEPRILRRWAYCIAAICFVATLLTGSRSPLIALFVTGLCATLMEPNRSRRLRWIIFIISVSAVVVTLCWTGLSERGTSLRPEVWLYSWKLCLQHFWFGAGLDAPLTIPMSVGEPLADTHNVFLAALFYGGAVGLLLFCATFFSGIFLSWRLHRRSPLAALASLLQIYGLLTLQFDGGCLISRPHEFWILYWLPIALYLRAAYATAPVKLIERQKIFGMDKLAAQELTDDSYFTNARLDMLDFVPNNASTLLDIGCGTGGFSKNIQRKPNTEVWGVELNVAAAESASKVLARVICGPIQDRIDDLPDKFFDCICMNDILEHLVDPWLTLDNLRSKLTDSGVLIASIPNVRHYKNLWSLLVKGEWTYTDSGTLDKTHLRFFTPKSMQRLFNDSGYTVLQLRGIRGSKKMKARIWGYLSLGRLWDIPYPQFAVVAKPTA